MCALGGITDRLLIFVVGWKSLVFCVCVNAFFGGGGVAVLILLIFSQVPGLTIWYGPDTYMGENLHKMLSALTEMSDEEIKAVHPRHDRVRSSLFLFYIYFIRDYDYDYSHYH